MHFRVASAMENVSILIQRAGHLLNEAGIAREIQTDVFACLDEAFSNIVQHGYHMRKDGWIDVSFSLTPDAFQITLMDRAGAFEIKDETPSRGEDLMKKEGNLGLGVYLMKQWMDDVRYEREGDVNCLTLLKKIAR